jgi:Uma2 family endonuclease
VTTIRTRPMTAEEFYDWANRPENRNRPSELERGEIVQMSRPGMRHGFICGNVARILGNFALRRGKGFVCANDTGVVVERNPDTVRGPDAMFFEGAPRLEEMSERYGEKPPLLAVEVLSPNDTTGKVMRRVREQFRFGTRLVWVLDPDARNVIVYRPGKEDYIVEQGEELTGDDVLADFRCPVGDFFGPAEAPPPTETPG